jgi:arylsulfatase A-like enzyme
MNKRPNIIIFNPDQFRADALGHMGCEAAATPNLDEFSKTEAVSFKYAFCQNPVCTPSRCSFMSGWYPHVRGHRTMFHVMHEDEPVLLRTLKEEGYFVWWGGKNDLTPGQDSLEPFCDVKYKDNKPLQPGLHSDLAWRGSEEEDNYYSFYAGKLGKGENEVYYDGDWSAINGAIDFIKNAPKDKPLCIYLPLGYPHPPYGVEEPWYSMIDRNKVSAPVPALEDWCGKPSILKGIYESQGIENWSEERFKELKATYYGMCSRIDEQFKRLMDALKEAHIYDDSAVFLFSDHGDFTGDYGLVEKTQNTFEDVLTRVPFIIKPPSWVNVEPGVRESLVELIDFPATVEALTGITPRHTHFGKSLLPIITGEVKEHRDAVFCEGGRLHGETHCMELESAEGIVQGGLYWPRLRWQIQEGPEHTKAVMCRTKDFKYVKRLYESDELYDLKEDPQELHNKINDPEYSVVLSKLKERLLTFYLETCDVVPHKPDSRH